MVSFYTANAQFSVVQHAYVFRIRFCSREICEWISIRSRRIPTSSCGKRSSIRIWKHLWVPLRKNLNTKFQKVVKIWGEKKSFLNRSLNRTSNRFFYIIRFVLKRRTTTAPVFGASSSKNHEDPRFGRGNSRVWSWNWLDDSGENLQNLIGTRSWDSVSALFGAAK